MMPLPTTAANSMAVPTHSAASAREVESVMGGSLRAAGRTRRTDHGQAPAGLLLESLTIAVGAHGMRHRMTGGLDDLPDDRVEVREPVVHPRALAARVDESCAPQIGEMPRSGGLRDPQGVVQVADADLAVDEQRQNAQPRAIRQRLVGV